MCKKISALCLTVLIILVSFTACGDTQTGNHTTSSEPVYSYTKGSVIVNHYRNEWMNMEIDMPVNYYEADAENYQMMETMGMGECGAYFVSDNSDTLAIMFADVSQYSFITADYFAQESIKETAEQMSGYGIDYELYSDAQSFTIADKTFKYTYLTIAGATTSVYAYKNGDIICCIMVANESLEESKELVSLFETMY